MLPYPSTLLQNCFLLRLSSVSAQWHSASAGWKIAGLSPGNENKTKQKNNSINVPSQTAAHHLPKLWAAPQSSAAQGLPRQTEPETWSASPHTLDLDTHTHAGTQKCEDGQSFPFPKMRLMLKDQKSWHDIVWPAVGARDGCKNTDNSPFPTGQKKLMYTCYEFAFSSKSRVETRPIALQETQVEIRSNPLAAGKADLRHHIFYLPHGVTLCVMCAFYNIAWITYVVKKILFSHVVCLDISAGLSCVQPP